MKPFIEPHTPEWQQARCGTLTSSEIHKIFVSGRKKGQLFGQGAMTYIMSKIGERMTLEIASAPDVPAVMWGLTEEPEARKRYESITGQNVSESGFYKYNSIFGGTTDGAIIINNEIDGILEIKCPNSSKHAAVLACLTPSDVREVDEQYYCQPQANMLITGAKYCDFISYDSRVQNPDLQIKIVRMYPDLEWRKEFELRINEAAAIMNQKLLNILKTPEANSQFRTEVTDNSKIEELSNTLANFN